MSNLLLWSQEFDNGAGWSIDGSGDSPFVTVTPNAIVAPDGTMTGDLLTFSPTGVGQYNDIDQMVSGLTTVGVTFTFSVWLRSVLPSQSVYLTVRDTSFTNAPSILVSPVSFGWQRYFLSVTPLSGATSTMDVQLFTSDFGTQEVYAWGAQLEASSFPTVYNTTTDTQFIVTATSPVDSRNYGDFPNKSRNFNGQDALIYDVQTSSNSSVPSVDSRSAGAPVDCRVPFNLPQNSRT